MFWGIAYGTSVDPSDAKPDFCGPPPFSFETWELNATFSVSERETIEVGTIGLSPTIATMLPTQPTGSVKLADVNSAGQVASTPHFGMAVGVVATLVSLQSLVV